MKMTLLEMVQSILDGMQDDEVNSIFDGTTSMDVAKIIKECYHLLTVDTSPLERKGIFHLDASTSPNKPTLMKLPSDVRTIEWLQYNIGKDLKDTNFRTLKYLNPVDFVAHSNNLNVEEDWVSSQTILFDGHPFEIKFRTDRSPSVYTSPNGSDILFDSFDKTIEDTLTSSRTYGYGDKVSEFKLEDDFIPDLSDTHFPLLLNMAKNQASVEIKQESNPLAASRERRLRILTKKTSNQIDNRPAIRKVQGYGRRGMR